MAGWHSRGGAYSEPRQGIEIAVIDLWAILSARSIKNVVGDYHYGPLAGFLAIRQSSIVVSVAEITTKKPPIVSYLVKKSCTPPSVALCTWSPITCLFNIDVLS